MSETTPLLDGPNNSLSRPKDVYDRFSTAQKQRILAVVSLAAMITPFFTGCFVPCVPQIARDLNTSATVINYTISICIVMIASGNLFWANYAGFYGRRPIYLVSLPLLCLGSLGAAISMNVTQLVISRTFQAIGASCVVSVGGATISDIYRLEERGRAMGVLFGTLVLSPALAPLVGGVTATYTSWRAVQLVVFAMALMAFAAIAIFLPETCHPGSRGVEKLILGEMLSESSTRVPVWKLVWINPFNQLALLRGPNILLVAIAGAFNLLTDFVLLIPMSYTLGPSYDIKSPALIGACFFVCGVGNIVGAPISGYLSDIAVIKGREKRCGKWVPEDRLRAALPGALIFVPLPVLIFGFVTQYVPGKVGLMMDLVCLFMNGVGVVTVLTPTSTYNLDIVHDRSAEAMAVGYFIRNGFCGIVSAAMLPMVNNFGVAVTNGIAALLAWIGFGFLWLTIRYGEKLRAWIDIGYTSSAPIQR